MQYPYANSVSGLKAVINQLRSAFPAKVTSETLKKWSIAPNNEAYVLGAIRFLGILDKEGKKSTEASKIFAANDGEFGDRFAVLVKAAYGGLFEHFSDEAWTLDEDRLVSFFRTEDSSSALVGRRQAQTFRALAELAGKVNAEASEAPKPEKKAKKATRTGSAATGAGKKAASEEVPALPVPMPQGAASQLTVRIEINLPIAEDQAVYDRIFKSLREHLVNG